MPSKGYVGVGIVEGEATPIGEFKVTTEDGVEVSITEAINPAPSPDQSEEDLEHYVRVRWIQSVSLDEAVKEKGFFGNQNTVARPKSTKWQHTIERLRKRFRIAD